MRDLDWRRRVLWRLLRPLLVEQAIQDTQQQHGGLPNARLPEHVEVHLVEALMGETVAKPDDGERGCLGERGRTASQRAK